MDTQHSPSLFKEAFRLSYKGRVTRLQYFVGVIIAWIIWSPINFIVLNIAKGIIETGKLTNDAIVVVTVFSFITVFTLFMFMNSFIIIRRLHDLGKPAWWYVFATIPILNSIVFLVLLLLRGTVGINVYGEDPLKGKVMPNDVMVSQVITQLKSTKIQRSNRNVQTIQVEAPLETVFDICIKTIEKIPAKVLKSDKTHGVIVAKTHMSLRSFGEKISVNLNKLTENSTQVQISSKSLVPTTIINSGENQDNVTRIAASLNGIFKDS